MKLYFLRHGQADWPDWDRPDDERPLTKKGKKETRRVANLLCDLGVKPAIILSSPLPRAFQTARIAARRLGIELREEADLGKEFSLPRLRKLISECHGEDLMVVGHEPNFSAVVKQLTGGRVEMAKAGVACLKLNAPKGGGTILWVVTPKIAKTFAK
ncbi:MAG: phosphohistidine phosphatase SixA [Verrucomicrobiota bacterium]|nr:phosphohistidine phosphatase SixA [Verrucomicrobiota bacterium]